MDCRTSKHMVKSERERKPYNKEIPGIELQNWKVARRRKKEHAKENTKVPSRGLNQTRYGVKENDYKRCVGDII